MYMQYKLLRDKKQSTRCHSQVVTEDHRGQKWVKKGGQKHKIVNIEDNNDLEVPKLHVYVI